MTSMGRDRVAGTGEHMVCIGVSSIWEAGRGRGRIRDD